MDKNIDAFDRKSFSEDIVRIIFGEKKGCAIAITGTYGSGKTFIMKMIRDELEKGHLVFFLNTWQYDINQNALEAVINMFSPYVKKDRKKIKKLSNLARDYMSPTFTIKLPFLNIRLNTPLRKTKNMNKTLGEFKECLSDLKKTLCNNGNKKIIIMIDEIDRCRPSFAVNLLEVFKHLFDMENSINGIHYIISYDHNQLTKIINHEYGDIDADNYLRRFFHMRYRLPLPTDYNNFLDGEFLSYKEILYMKNSVISVTNKVGPTPRNIQRILPVLYGFHMKYKNIFDSDLEEEFFSPKEKRFVIKYDDLLRSVIASIYLKLENPNLYHNILKHFRDADIFDRNARLANPNYDEQLDEMIQYFKKINIHFIGHVFQIPIFLEGVSSKIYNFFGFEPKNIKAPYNRMLPFHAIQIAIEQLNLH
jgi:hypothetical protein